MAEGRSRWPAWRAQLVEGAFRGPRSVAVAASAAAFALAALMTLAQTGVSQRSWTAGVDLGEVRGSGSLRFVVVMDTRGAPLRVEADPSLQVDHGGWVEERPRLQASFDVGARKLHLRLINPAGDVWSQRDKAPGDRAVMDHQLVAEGVWRLEVFTRDAQGMTAGVGVDSVEPPSPLAAPQPVATLLLVLLCCLAIVVAPRPPRGARLSGVLLACAAACVPLVFFLGHIVGFPGAAAPVALLLVAAFAGPAVLGWSFPRRSVRRVPAVLAVVLLGGAVILAAGSAPGTEAMGEGFFTLMHRERYDEAARLVAFCGVPIVLWLAGALAGLASAPFRRSASWAEQPAPEPWPQALAGPRLAIGAVAAALLVLGLAWALTGATMQHPRGIPIVASGISRLLADWIGLLAIAMVAMSAGRRGVWVAASALMLAALSAPLLVPLALEDGFILPPYRSWEGMPRSAVVLTGCCLALAFVAGMLPAWSRPRRVSRRQLWLDATLVACSMYGLLELARIAGMPHSGENPGLPQDAFVSLTWLAAVPILAGLWAVVGWRVGRWTAPGPRQAAERAARRPRTPRDDAGPRGPRARSPNPARPPRQALSPG